MQQCLPIPLPKAKFESLGDSNEETVEDALAAIPNVGDLEVPSSSTKSLSD